MGTSGRADGRRADQMRPLTIEKGFIEHAEGSALVRAGSTHVLCTASVEDRVPPWLKGQGRGWVTSEYSMLPRSTRERTRREISVGRPSGRSQEIQRLIGRALRAVTDLTTFGERNIVIDCDVIKADGGTRCAAITGAWVALAEAFVWIRDNGILVRPPLSGQVAAVSVGIVGGEPVLDLNYEEDSAAAVDMNVVRTDAGAYVELQGTAEKTPFGRSDLEALLALADAGTDRLFEIQREALSGRADALIRTARAARP